MFLTVNVEAEENLAMNVQNRHHQQEIFELGPQPEMIDDFIRNYFANVGLTKTLSQVKIKILEIVYKILLIFQKH